MNVAPTEEPLVKVETEDTRTVVTTPPSLSCTVETYLLKPIHISFENDPADVKMLEKFLNTYENANLTVDGIYSREDFDAVVKWQEKYAEDILAPWGIKK